MVDKFLNYLEYEKYRSPLTVKRYGRTLRDFQEFFKGTDSQMEWQTVDADIIRRWAEALMEKGNTASSVGTDLAALRTFFRFMLARKEVEKDPTATVTNPRKQKALPHFVKESEMDSLLDESQSDDNIENVRARTIIILLYETGLRRSELVGLNMGDVDLDSRQLKVTGKGNKQRIVPFGAEVAQAIGRMLELRGSAGLPATAPLFTDKRGRRMSGAQVYRIVRKQLTGHTLSARRSPHVLRHSYATALLNNGAKIESVRQLLGHSSAQTTMVYTHATFEQMKRVYKQAHPRESDCL